MDPSMLLKQSMGDCLGAIWGLNEPHHSQNHPSETGGDDWKFSQSPQAWDPEHLLDQRWQQGNNPLGTINGLVPNQTNVSTAQASQPTNISNSSVLKRNLSSLSETERAKKRRIDQAYRAKNKKLKEEMQSNLGILSAENDSLNKENESLKKDNASMNETLRDQAKEIDQLRSDLLRLKREHEKQNVLVETLSGLLVFGGKKRPSDVAIKEPSDVATKEPITVNQVLHL